MHASSGSGSSERGKMKLIEHDYRLFESGLNRRIPNGMYGGVRGQESLIILLDLENEDSLPVGYLVDIQ